MNRGSYLGVDFQVWRGGRTWLWLVNDPGNGAGATGTAIDEQRAVREACQVIEERSTNQREIGSAFLAAAAQAAVGWRAMLDSLERHLGCRAA